jgi:diguanylate cyclase (GGDEF)-like protein/PAS domain S-box-containing protein
MTRLNQLPCPVLITDVDGLILDANSAFVMLVGATAEQCLNKPMGDLFAAASRAVLQDRIWPLLRAAHSIREERLQIMDQAACPVPVFANAQRGQLDGSECFYWVFFVAQELSRFEAKLLDARHRAEEAALELARRERFISAVADAMPGLVAYWDTNLRCQYANKPYLEWFGKSPEAMRGMDLRELLGERLFAANEAYIKGALAGEKQRFERVQPRPDGSIGHTWGHYIPNIDEHGVVRGFYALVSDVTPLKAAEEKLRLAASVFDSAQEGIMVTDLEGVIESVNPAFTVITGYSAEDAIGKTPRLLRSEHHDREYFAAIWHEISTIGQWQGETWNRRKDGSIFLVWQTITRIDGPDKTPVRYVSVFHDITNVWEKNERTTHLAFHDALTGLPNRLLLMDRLEQLMSASDREPRYVVVMFQDLDRFKSVNDSLGHDVGDELLKVVAVKLLGQVRQSDTVARLGGDEFVIVLDNPANREEVAQIAARIVASINEPMAFRGKPVTVGTSIGIAVYPDDGDTPAQLIRNADTAMYAAKQAGKNTYRFFVAEPDASFAKRAGSSLDR